MRPSESDSQVKPAVINALGVVFAALVATIGSVIVIKIQNRPPPPPPPPPPSPVASTPTPSVTSTPMLASPALSIKEPKGDIPRCVLVRIEGTDAIPKGAVVWLASQPKGASVYYLREVPGISDRPRQWKRLVDVQNTNPNNPIHIIQAIAMTRATSDAFRNRLDKWNESSQFPRPLLATSERVSVRRAPARNEPCQ
jgi:hypothetical protein